jgi:nucleoid DNA-binding protein
MRKADLVQRIAAALGCTTTKAEAAVEAVLSTMKAALQQGEPLILRHFGTLTVRTTRARMGRNPKTGADAAIPARRVVRFKAGKPLKQVVAGTMPPSDAGDSSAQHLPTRTAAPAVRLARRRRPTAR